MLAYATLSLSGLAQPLLAAAAGTAGLVYLGTALLSGHLVLAGLDLAAAGGAMALALAGGGMETVAAAWRVHAHWGTARSTPGDPARGRLTNWSALAGGLAILVLLG